MLSVLVMAAMVVAAVPMMAVAENGVVPMPLLRLTADPHTVVVAPTDLLAAAPTEAPLAESNLSVTLQSELEWSEMVRIEVVVDADTEAHVQAWFEDSMGNWYNSVLQGFGPPGGFTVDPGYNETTEFYVIADEPGTYEATLNLWAMGEGDWLADSVTVTVEVVEPCKTIAEIAQEAGIFNTLLAAAGIAGLDGALADPDYGPVTVFAPTDTAFAALEAALGEEAWAALLADPDTLRDVLLYHLLAGEVYAADVLALVADGPASVTTLLGEDIVIELTDDGVVINGVALVIQTDIQACNGVIHIIDTVLVPPADEEPPVADEDGVDEAEAEEVLVPALPATGIGPDSRNDWSALVLASLVLGLAYSARRRNALARH